jgi:hypothetical protein
MCALSTGDHSSDALILQRFLAKPSDRTAYDAFFELCYRLTTSSLGYLKSRGQPLPVDNTNPDRGFEDLTCRILGEFLAPGKGRRNQIIFSFFERQGIADFATMPADHLFDLFLGLQRNFVRQEVFRQTRQEDRQLARLEKTFKDILRTKGYQSRLSRGPNRSGVLPDDKLNEIVEAAFLDANNDTEWCARIFDLVDQLDKPPAKVNEYSLIRFAVDVRLRHVELEGFRASVPPGPIAGAIAEQLPRIRDEVLRTTTRPLVERFVGKGRLKPDEAEAFVQAAEIYLIDHFDGGGVDSIPEYFREAVSNVDSKEYLRDYKYIFETVIHSAVEEMRNRLRNDPIIRSLRYY